jgi:hypothetical protein
MQHNRKQAIIYVIERINDGEIASVEDAILQAHGGLEQFIIDAYEDYRRRELTQVNRTLNKGLRRSHGIQLMFEGFGYGTLPNVRDGDKIVPADKATFKQMQAQVKRERRDVNFDLNIVEAKEKLLIFLQEHNTPPEWTGAQIQAKWQPAEDRPKTDEQ